MSGKLFPALFLIVAVAGCSRSRAAPTVPTPDELTLYAIDGLVDEPKSFVSDATHFRGYEILGKVEIRNRREITSAFRIKSNWVQCN